MTSIGIRYDPHLSSSSGINQTAIWLAELFSTLGHQLFLVHTTETEKTALFPLISLYHVQKLDLLLDIDGQFSSELRQKASRTIVFLRTFLQFAELDSVVYLETPYSNRSFKGVHEIWCWDVLNPKETLPSIQTLFPCPIRTVPFIWSPTLIQEESKGAIASFCEGSWTVHVSEKNKENTSSCVFPLVAVRELSKKNVIHATYLFHHMDRVKENRFLKENVLQNIESDTLPITFAPNGSFVEWIQEPNSILFSHSRFTPLRIGLLNALWLGLPVVHNSPVLRTLHPLLSNLFYTGNNVREISAAFSWIQSHSAEWHAALPSIRQAMLEMFSKKEEWACLLKGVFVPSAVPSVVPSAVPSAVPSIIPNPLVIAFSDMWPGFNYDSNFLIDTLRHSYPKIRGIAYSKEAVSHLLVFGPYGQTWKTIDLPKIFFSAENWSMPSDPSIKLYLTSAKEQDDTHLRIPTWMTFIDWHSGSTELPSSCEDNPIRLPLHFATTPHPISFSERKGFCGFVVSNPICSMRNDTFHLLNEYKTVDSGGALYNNIGGQLSLKYPGGGCGDISKHHFFAEKQFTISFENSQASGYITEKVLHSKMAGCVPLYWGDKDTNSDFAPHSLINLSSTSDPNLVLQVLKKLEANPEMCAKIAATPILNEEKVWKARTILSSIAEKVLGLVGIPLIQGIEQTFVINLDSRPDRWNKLLEAEPYLEPLVERISGVNGKTLEMNPDIYRMFEKNQFQWKKSVIGCNLSHISVWKRIAESATEGFYLVLEDDVRFQKGWLASWKKCVQDIPKDADLLYLGGVLPPNKKGLSLATEYVTENWSQIKPNTLFSPVPLPLFHFCAYSYVLTRAGARKLMSYLTDSEQKSFTVSDHLLGHPSVGLKKYFTNPLLSYCFQEEDPVYLASAFNDLHREDTFDSDIWNNKECFSESELAPFKKTVYYMTTDHGELYEKLWLEDILQVRLDFQRLPPLKVDFPADTWFLVQRPYVAAWNEFFKILQQNEVTFQVLHVSDEFCNDDISFYHLPNCKKVIRNYLREVNLPDVYTIPLGYHHRSTKEKKSWDNRELLWSFHGTNWFDRAAQLEPLRLFEPHSCHLQPNWNHSTATKEKPYVSLLENTKFCPILKGQNVETFRLYEALEAGALPITTITDPVYLKWIEDHLELSSLYPWTDPVAALTFPVTEEIQRGVTDKWNNWKGFLRELFSRSI